MKNDLKRLFCLTTLGILSCSTCLVAAGILQTATSNRLLPVTACSHATARSQSCNQDWAISGPDTFAAIGAMLLLVTGALVPVVPLHKPVWPTGNGHTDDQGNGHRPGGIKTANGSGEDDASFAEQYREIFEGTDDLIYAHDLQGRLTCFNPALLQTLGYTAAELDGLTVHQLVAPECRDLVGRMMGAKLALGRATKYELTLITRQGERREFEVSSHLVHRDGKPAGVHGIARDITSRKRAEAAVTEGNELLEALLENSREMIYFKDRESRFIRCSRAFLNRFNLTDPAAIKGRTDFDLFTRDHAQQAYADEQEIMHSGTSINGKLEMETHRDGRITWVKTSKTAWRDREGNIIGTLGISSDVSKLKETEDKLAAERELLRTLLDSVPEIIYFKDRESRFVHVSSSLVARTIERVPQLLNHAVQKTPDNGSSAVTDVPGEELLIGLTDFDLFTEEHARVAYEDEQAIIGTGKPVIGKLEKETHLDGTTTWVLTSKMPWRDKDGNIVGTFGISQDVTGIKEAETQLAYEQGLLRTLLDKSPDTIYFKDRESHFVLVSRSKVERSQAMALARFRTANPGQELPTHLVDLDEFGKFLLGKTDFDIFPEDRARSAYDDEQEIIRTGEPIIDKIERTLCDDRSVVWQLTTKLPWRDQEGKIIGTFGISKDITDLKRAESQLAEAHKRLMDTSRLAGMAEVATDVLHNVGNVLNSINVSCSLVVERVQQTSFANLARIPQMLRENVGRLDVFLAADPKGKHIPDFLTILAQTIEDQQSFLVHELNQLRRHIDHIKQVVAMQQSYAKVAGIEETIEVTPLVEDALQINAGALDRHHVELRREFEPVAPVLVDKHKVLQILVNLIRNAKYALSDTDRPDKIITVRVLQHGDDRVRIEVADNGVGIAHENLSRIFAHGFTTRRDGHGFGLHSGALAARELGGSLTAQSEGLGKGATFTLEIPVKQHEPPAPA